MNAVAQVAIGESHYLMGGNALWSVDFVGFNFNFTPGITTWMVTFWGVMIFMIVLGALAARKRAMVPTGWQNFGEWSFGGLTNFFAGVVGDENNKVYGPILVTLFIFILLSNYSGMLPLNFMTEEGVMGLENLQAPTGIFSVTLGFAVLIFLITIISGFRFNKFSYVKHLFMPLAFLLPLNLLESVVHPFTLALRLFGNIGGEEEVIIQLANLVPLGVPVAMEILGMLFGLIQALVFTLLSAIYISTAAGKGH